jgi:hypothetical protein
MAGEEESYEDYVFELGDHIAINTARYGIVKGFIYYRDMDLIRIMPDGVSDRLYDFSLDDGEFSKELGFKTASWISKNPLPSFVEQQDLQAGQHFETFTANGEPAGSYKIESVNIDDDTIVAEDESGAQTEITFGYIGIPLDLPFAVLRIREPPAESKASDDVTSYGINLNSDEAQAEKEAELGITVSSDFVRELEETTAQVAAIDDALEAGRPVDDDDYEDVEIQDYVRLPVFEQTFEKPSALRSYPEELQKSDALQDFTSFLSVKQQQDIRQLRKIRQLTEMCAQLKNEVILYKASDHTFESLIPQSYTYINELLNSGVIMPLRRPILDVNLRVFEIVNDKLKWPLTNATIINETVRGIVNQPKVNEVSWDHVNDIVNEALGALPELPDNGDQSHLDIQNFTTFLTDLTDAKLGTKYIGINRPSFYEQEVRTQNLIGRPWKRTRELPDHMWAAREDSEFLRAAVPDLAAPATIEGLESGETLRGNFDPATVAIGRVKLSMKRALGPIYRKGRIPLLNAEDAPVKSNVIFPLEYKLDLGTHRSGLLLHDSMASQIIKRTIFEVLQEAGPINSTAHTNSILTVGIDGNTDGNIKMSDFIGKFPLQGLGPTYVVQPLANYGLANKEINMETAEVIMNKVKDNINSVKAYIKKLREELAAASPEPTTANIFIEDIKQWLLGTVIEAEPLLAEIMRRFKTMAPGAASESDIAIISYIYTKEPDLFLAAAGGNPDQVAYERMMAGLRFNIATVKEGLALRAKIESSGEEPQPNPCEHVAALNSITLIEDPEERMYYKGQFVNRYQGQRVDNWIKCSVCARDLVCVHELLELEMFNRPQERDVLRKEMYLHFCGPVMGNYYSCRNCGQSLGEIEFDNNIQFDDQGRPMMGRAMIVDQDAIKMEQINQTIMAATEEVKTIDFGDAKKNQIYFTIKEVTDRLSIYPTMTDYEQMISMILTELGSFISRDDFVAKFSAENPDKKIPDYDVLLNRHIVINTCCVILIHIQSRIPDYQPIAVLAGCKNPGFGGYPIGAADNLTGIEYIACAVGSIMKNDIPWNMTGFQKESDGKRQKAIATMMQRQIQKLMEKANIQQILLDKRRYLKDIYGAAAEGIEGKVNDEISKFFLPAQRIITAKDAAEAETVIIPEVNSHTTQVGRSAIWIQKANRVAKDTGLERGEILIGSPFTEGAVCYSAIKKPQGFWDEGHGLPTLQERRLERGAAGTQMTVPFVPKPLVNIIATAPANIYYKLFLAVCWQGDRKGLPHEFGFNHRCPHCELTIVPYEKSITDIEFDPKSYKKYMGEVARFKEDYEAYMSSQFETQGIQINEESFQDLLTATHRRYSVKPFERPKHMNVFDVLRSVALLDPAPITEWPAVIEHTISELSKLDADSNIGDIQEALDQLSQLGPNALKEIAIDRYPRNENLIQVLQGLVSMQPSEIGEALTSHFILPMQRLINFVDPAAFVRLSPDLISPNEQQKISKEHLEDIQNFIMYNNNVLSTYHGDFAPGKNELAKAKIDFCVKQLAQIPPLLQKLNINTLIGGERTFKYLIQALVFCPLRTLLDPNTLPSAQYRQDARAAYGDTSFSVIGRVLASCILKYKDDRMLYSDEQIQAALQDRIEKEEIKVIRDYDVLDDEDKYLKIMRKNIGIEEYAVGGTKAIQQYDDERYEIERKERADAGHVDFNFALVDPNVFYPLGGRVYDPNSEDTIFGNDDVGEGYDHNDHDDDDY